MKIAITIGASLAFAAQACPPSPVPPDAGDAAAPDAAMPDAGATIYQRACSNLASLGCQEGVPSACAATLEKIDTDRTIRGFDATCIAIAKTKADARKCAGVSCP